jgi:hypothetical protein
MSTLSDDNTIYLLRPELEHLLIQAAQRGAETAIRRLVTYNYADAANRLGVCENTLRKRIRERKIHPVDGRITEAEIQRYLTTLPQAHQPSG